MVIVSDFLHLYAQGLENALSWGEPLSTPVHLILRGGISSSKVIILYMPQQDIYSLSDNDL